MAPGTRTGSNPNVADLSGILQLFLGRSNNNASYIPAGGGMGGRRGTSGRATFSKPTGSLRNYGADYKEQELAAGAVAERSRPGAGFPGQQGLIASPGTTPGASSFAPIDPYAAQNREYERERARVEAMVKANPDMQKQAIADERAKVRDQGMAIWAAKYGGPDGLASKVKPGAVGYDAIQRTLYPGGAPVPALPAESEAMLNAVAPANEFGVRPDVTPMPGQLPSFGSATESMFNAVTGGGSLVTPMPQTAPTPQTQAQDLAEAYRQAMLARILTNK